MSDTPEKTPTASTPPPSAPRPARVRIKNPNQAGRTVSPWSLREKIGMGLWLAVQHTLFRFTPKPLNRWRLWLLRRFGARIEGNPFVHPAAIIKIPWQFTMMDKAALAPHAEVYNLGHVTLGPRCVVAQYTYLCGGTHDLEDPMLPLQVGDIVIGEEAFIGAKALILPGVTIGDGAVVGAGAVVSRDVPAWMICAGNPCKPIKPRTMRKA